MCAMITMLSSCKLLVFVTISVGCVMGDCGVVTRQEWEADKPDKVKYLARPLGLVIIEHTETPACTTDAGCAEMVRNIQTLTWIMEMQHYPDIAYSFLVGGNGKVYEGTGWLHVGAHTSGYNSKSIAIAFIGNLSRFDDQPTPAMVEAAQALLKCGVERGHLKPDYNLVGARQLIATHGPGRMLYNEIRSWPNYLEYVQSKFTPHCGVVTRQEWEAIKPNKVKYLARPVGLVIIEHTDTRACTTDAGCAEMVRNIQTLTWLIQMQHYPDIAYSFLVGGNGKVYEGTGWLHVGAHTSGYNSKSIAIAFIGNMSRFDDQPTPAMVEAAQALLKCGVERGHLKSDYNLVGARQLIATQSPGRKLYNEIRSWPNYLEDVSSLYRRLNTERAYLIAKKYKLKN